MKSTPNIIKLFFILFFFVNAHTYSLQSEAASNAATLDHSHKYESQRAQLKEKIASLWEKSSRMKGDVENTVEPGNFLIRLFISATASFIPSTDAEGFGAALAADMSSNANSLFDLKFGFELGFKKFLKPIKKNQVVPAEIIDQIVVLPKKRNQVMPDTNIEQAQYTTNGKTSKFGIKKWLYPGEDQINAIYDLMSKKNNQVFPANKPPTKVEKFKTFIKNVGKLILKALAISVVKWLAEMALKSAILVVLPFLAPFVIVWDIYQWVKKTGVGISDTEGKDGWKTVKVSYTFAEAEGVGSLAANFEIDFNYRIVKAAVTKFCTWIKNKIQSGVRSIGNKISSMFKRNRVLSKESKTALTDNMKNQKFKQELENEATHMSSTTENQNYLTDGLTASAVPANYKPATTSEEAATSNGNLLFVKPDAAETEFESKPDSNDELVIEDLENTP